MRPDLLEAQASVDWVWSKLPDLTKQIGVWLERNVTLELRDPGGDATHNLIAGVQKERLPLSFHVEVGAYVNVIRSSLDILATALVRRHSVNIEEDKVYFPIARSEAGFANKKWLGRKLLDALPAKERELIESLKPYQGGNHTIWSMHHLDIVRKHRQLLAVGLRPITIALRGTLAEGDFIPLAVVPMRVNDMTIVGMLRKGVDVRLAPSTFNVRFNEEGHFSDRPILNALAHLIDVAGGIIALFDY